MRTFTKNLHKGIVTSKAAFPSVLPKRDLQAPKMMKANRTKMKRVKMKMKKMLTNQSAMHKFNKNLKTSLIRSLMFKYLCRNPIMTLASTNTISPKNFTLEVKVLKIVRLKMFKEQNRMLLKPLNSQASLELLMRK